jgi:acetolactate synthase small subunit
LLSLFHRRVLEIERLTAERAQDPAFWRITIAVQADADLARRIEANLYKLEDVLFVERSEPGQEFIGERNLRDVNS